MMAAKGWEALIVGRMIHLYFNGERIPMIGLKYAPADAAGPESTAVMVEGLIRPEFDDVTEEDRKWWLDSAWGKYLRG